MLDTKIVSNDTVHPGTSIIQVIIGEHDENSVLAFLAFDQNGVTTEELQRLHRVVREADDGVVIVGGISDTRIEMLALSQEQIMYRSYMREFGFFFFFRMAVDVSVS
jgi:hypothetical protein